MFLIVPYAEAGLISMALQRPPRISCALLFCLEGRWAEHECCSFRIIGLKGLRGREAIVALFGDTFAMSLASHKSVQWRIQLESHHRFFLASPRLGCRSHVFSGQSSSHNGQVVWVNHTQSAILTVVGVNTNPPLRRLAPSCHALRLARCCVSIPGPRTGAV